LIASLVAIALGVVGTLILLKVVDLVIGLRVSGEDEVVGLDLSQHGEEGYNLDMDVIAGGYTGEPYAKPTFAAAATEPSA
jgi:ammonia channel protein AmtB